jgi:hypothetical protein
MPNEPTRRRTTGSQASACDRISGSGSGCGGGAAADPIGYFEHPTEWRRLPADQSSNPSPVLVLASGLAAAVVPRARLRGIRR